MGSAALDHAGVRPKKGSGGSQLWKKALLHSSLCFVMGFFTGFAPSSVSDWRSAAPVGAGGLAVESSHVLRTLHSAGAGNRTLLAQGGAAVAAAEAAATPRPLLVVVTTTESTPTASGERAAMLTRMAHALRLVPPPLLWVVVEAAPDVPATARLLRDTGLLYRHLTYKDNFTAAEAAAGKERHHQRNAALEHIERHRLAGVVHFAGLGDVFELRFFDQIRQISTFGAWPVARMSRGERKVLVQGPACSASKVIGWFSGTSAAAPPSARARPREAPPTAPVPARRGRRRRPRSTCTASPSTAPCSGTPSGGGRYPTSEPDKSRFVQQVVTEDYRQGQGHPFRLLRDHGVARRRAFLLAANSGNNNTR
ncbi:hypothetical protein ACQ4PT_005003 [Festuca glaucescens]